MQLNNPTTVAELAALYPRYETALVTNDIETLTSMFWHSPEVMRFGVTENLYGFEELDGFRRSRPVRWPDSDDKTPRHRHLR